jgi:hypothetical protein
LNADKDLKKDEGEAINWDAAINIHHGGKWKIPATRGCQAIRHWDKYLEFIETLEKDYTIKGTESNELAQPRAGGNRPVVYTLVTGEFLRSVAQNDRQPASEAPSSNGTSSEGSASEGGRVRKRGFLFLSLPFEKPPDQPSSQKHRTSGMTSSIEKSLKGSTQGNRNDQMCLAIHDYQENLDSETVLKSQYRCGKIYRKDRVL